jgi:hypothetical protein
MAPWYHGGDANRAYAQRWRNVKNAFGIYDPRFGSRGPEVEIAYRALGSAVACPQAIRAGAHDIAERHWGDDAGGGLWSDSGDAD